MKEASAWLWRMKVSARLLNDYLQACRERDTDPRVALEYWLECFIRRIGYAEAARRGRRS